MKARGVLDGDVVVADPAQANRLHSKGSFGTPQSGNSLRLSLLEAAYNVQQGRLEVEGTTFADLLQDEVRYLAYADLRDRGLVVRHEGDHFLVWRRGEGPKQEPWFHFTAAAENEPITAAGLRPGVLGVVDEDGVVTHYLVEAIRPEGRVQQVDLPAIEGTLLRDRILIDDATPHREEFIGTPHAGRFILSRTEAQALARRGVLDLDLGPADAVLPVYEDLRAHGVVARSGFRFGTHLRAYETGPDESHATWLVHCTTPDAPMHWSALSRGVRLAHGVRKTFVVASGPYVAMSWFRP